MEVAKTVMRTSSSLMSSITSLPSSIASSIPSSLSLSFSFSSSAPSAASTSHPTSPTVVKKKKVAPPKWSTQMSIAVPIYRTALHRTRHSIKRTRSLLTILPTPTPENVRIDPVSIPRREDIVLSGMSPEEARGSVPGEWVTFHPRGAAAAPPPPSTASIPPTRSPSPETDSERVILFLHGGAFIMGSPASHRCLTAKFAELAGAKVLAVDYRLAPEHPFPLPLHCCISAYLSLVDPRPSAALGSVKKPTKRYRPDQIFLVGDSAGGGLSIALSLWLRDNGYAPPGGIVAMAPWVDLTHSQPSFHLNGAMDYLPDSVTDPEHIVPGVRSHAYTRADTENVNPYVSPLFGSDEPMKGVADARLPPTLIQVGERERLRDEGIMLAARSFSRSPIRLEVYKDMVHVFQTFGDPVAEIALRRAGEFIRSLSSTRSDDRAGGVVARAAADGKSCAPGFLRVGTDGEVEEMGRRAAVMMVEEGRMEVEREERRRRIASVAGMESVGWWAIATAGWVGGGGGGGGQTVESPVVAFGSTMAMPTMPLGVCGGPGDLVGRIERRMQLPLYRVV
ncbi:hypothetical protein HDU67_008773 [Dinochytrium kinnereticum]|nr:hypothetical protein HDU67_008773 [Dinochytrium kinnereticum]